MRARSESSRNGLVFTAESSVALRSCPWEEISAPNIQPIPAIAAPTIAAKNPNAAPMGLAVAPNIPCCGTNWLKA